MKKSNFTFLFILAFIWTYAQSDIEINAQNQLDLLKQEQLAANNTSDILPFSSTSQRDPLDDGDDDGMDDDWESDNGLDPSNPFDAWGDLDGDQILNLFEFQLQADPNNSASPQIIQFTEGAEQSEVSDALDLGETQPIVLRFAQGTYTYSILAYYGDDYYVMIQGGWNDDFSDYDPTLFTTEFNNPTDEIIVFGRSSSSLNVQSSTVILDGITVSKSGGFSLGGGIQMYRHNDKNIDRTSIYKCRFLENNFYGLGISHKNAEALSEVFIVKSIFGNNIKGGIYTQVTEGKNARWRILNSTFHNPGSTDGGIDGLTADEEIGSRLLIENTNTINYGNDEVSFNFFNNDSIFITADHSTMDAPVAAIVIQESNAVNSDPVFENVAGNDFFLSDISPLIDAGVDIGLLYGGTAPEIGAEEINEPSSLQDINQISFTLFPTLIDNQQRELSISGLENGNYNISVTDMDGRNVFNKKLSSKTDALEFTLDRNLNSGVYNLVVQDSKNKMGSARIIVVE